MAVPCTMLLCKVAVMKSLYVSEYDAHSSVLDAHDYSSLPLCNMNSSVPAILQPRINGLARAGSIARCAQYSQEALQKFRSEHPGPALNYGFVSSSQNYIIVSFQYLHAY